MERSLELAIWDHDRIGKTQDFLGGARFELFFFFNLIFNFFQLSYSRFNLGSGRHLGRNVGWMDGTGKEVSLWQQMLDRPNFWVEGCIGLRPSLDTRPVQWKLSPSPVTPASEWPLTVTSTCCSAPTPTPSLPSTTFSYQSRCLWVHYLWYGHKYPISCDIDMSVTETTIFCT